MVSVIIPIYNVSPYVERCLYSVLNQTYEDLDLILIDDCGTDNSMNIVSNIIEKYVGNKKISVFKHERNRGLSAARNTGIKNATGDYLLFLDSDDEIPLNAVEMMLEPTKENLDFVVGNIKVFGSDMFRFNFSLPSGLVIGNDSILDSYIEGKWYSMSVNKLIRKDFVLKNDLFFKEGILHEDELWSFKLALKANRMYVLRDYTYNCYIRNDSITGNVTVQNYESNAVILVEKYALIKVLDRLNLFLYILKLTLDFYFSLLVFRPPYKILKDINFQLRENMKLNWSYMRYLNLSYKLKYILFRVPYFFFKYICS